MRNLLIIFCFLSSLAVNAQPKVAIAKDTFPVPQNLSANYTFISTLGDSLYVWSSAQKKWVIISAGSFANASHPIYRVGTTIHADTATAVTGLATKGRLYKAMDSLKAVIGVPTLQQVLSSGATLTQYNSIDVGGNILDFTNAGGFRAHFPSGQAGINMWNDDVEFNDATGTSLISLSGPGGIYLNNTNQQYRIVNPMTADVDASDSANFRPLLIGVNALNQDLIFKAVNWDFFASLAGGGSALGPTYYLQNTVETNFDSTFYWPTWDTTIIKGRAFRVSSLNNLITVNRPADNSDSTTHWQLQVNQGNFSLSSIGGSLNISQINATGTPSASTYLRGDGTWAAGSGGSNWTVSGSDIYRNSRVLVGGSTFLTGHNFGVYGRSVFTTTGTFEDLGGNSVINIIQGHQTVGINIKRTVSTSYSFFDFKDESNNVLFRLDELDNLMMRGKIRLGQGTFPTGSAPTASLDISASNTGAAQIRLRDGGSAPTSPNNGDIWVASNHLYIRLNGVTYQLDQQGGGTITLSGDVSGSGTTSITTTIGNDVVTYAKMQNVSATNRLLGRITAGAGDIEELTGTQATTLLDVFTSTLKGLVPASGGGTTNFLRADGTWAAPPGGGGTVTSFTFTDGNGFDGTVTNSTTTPTLSLTTTVSNNQVMYSNGGAITGSSDFTWSNSTKTLHLLGATTGNTSLNIERSSSGVSVFMRFFDLATSGLMTFENGASSGFLPIIKFQPKTWAAAFYTTEVTTEDNTYPAVTMVARRVSTGAALTTQDVWGVMNGSTKQLILKANGTLNLAGYSAPAGNRLLYLNASKDIEVTSLDPANLIKQGANTLTEQLQLNGSVYLGGAVHHNIYIHNETDHTVAATDYIIELPQITSGGNLKVHLPTGAPAIGRKLILINKNDGGVANWVTNVSIKDIGGTTTTTIPATKATTLVYDGTDWLYW